MTHSLSHCFSSWLENVGLSGTMILLVSPLYPLQSCSKRKPNITCMIETVLSTWISRTKILYADPKINVSAENKANTVEFFLLPVRYSLKDEKLALVYFRI